jgi:peptidoglycan hydrolase-like protein with peptidoglycan-binding domain
MTVAGMLAALAASVLPASAAHAAAPPAPGNFTGFGFDTCVAPSQSVMDAWNLSSPYSAIGIYISGNSRYCGDQYQPNLSPSWVATNAARGWRFLPIHVGYQAPCFRNNPDSRVQKKKMSSTFSVAESQARSDADEAVAALKRYGFAAKAFIYLDIEWYDRSDRHCDYTVRHFVDAFNERVRSLGYMAGLYSSGSAAIKSIDEVRSSPDFHLPSHMWFAWTNKKSNTDGGPYLSDSGWQNHRRIHQYHNGVSQSFDGKRLTIDKDFLDVGTGSQAPTPERYCGFNPNWRSWPVVKLGDSNGHVTVMQCRLKALGFTETVDGTVTSGTLKAINDFRQSKGWARNSTTSRAFWTALLAAGHEPRVMKYGSVSQEVWRLQRTLTAAGWTVPLNGFYNSATISVVRAYRKANGLPGYDTTTSAVWRLLKAGKRGR